MSPQLKNRKKEGRKEKKVWGRDVYQMDIRDRPNTSRKQEQEKSWGKESSALSGMVVNGDA